MAIKTHSLTDKSLAEAVFSTELPTKRVDAVSDESTQVVDFEELGIDDVMLEDNCVNDSMPEWYAEHGFHSIVGEEYVKSPWDEYEEAEIYVEYK